MTEPLSAEQSAKSDALRLIGFAPRSKQELRERLAEKRHESSVIDGVLAQLEKAGLVNDEKFARVIADSKIYIKPIGRRLLLRDLKNRGLSPEVVQKTMDHLKDYDELSAAKEVALKRMRTMGDLPAQKKKARLYGFLQRRGFSGEAIDCALSATMKNDRVA